MLVPTEWLNEFVELPSSVEELSRCITQLGLEVDTVKYPDKSIKGLKIIDVLSVETHSNDDGLHVCTLTDGEVESRVVTAATNIEPGAKYVWAPPGSRLNDGTLGTETVDGVESMGMLCSLEELGLASSSASLLKLSPSAETGSPAVETLKLDRPILELDLTPNRADCLSIIGVARDYATRTGASFEPPETSEPDYSGDDSPDVIVDEPGRCNKYVGMKIHALPIGSSSLTVQTRLAHLGIQPKTNVVDATNYVLFEQGNPLHAFDLNQMDTPVVIRCAREEEGLRTIDGSQLDLNTDDLVIADQNHPHALAGVMGGATSAVDEVTSEIFLEGAHFEPGTVRRSSSRHNLRTDSSHRFERGVDSTNVLNSMYRFVDLLLETTEGTPKVNAPTRKDNSTPSPGPIRFDPSTFQSLVGFDPDLSMESTLGRLGCEVDASEESWAITPPSYRHDLNRNEDLIEELLRMEGYNSVSSDYPALQLNESPLPERRLEDSLRDVLSSWGFNESLTFSFHAEDEYRFERPDDHVRLRNPLSREHSVLRQTLLDSLLPVFESNIEAGQTRLNLFEIGRVFRTSGEEPLKLAMLSTGPKYGEGWDEKEHSEDFYDLKGTVEALLDLTGYVPQEFVPREREGLKKNRAAAVEVRNTRIGWLGELSTGLVRVDHGDPVWATELDLSSLPEPRKTSYNPYSKQPFVKRDLDLVVNRDLYARDLRKCIEETAVWLDSLEVFDLYRGDPLPDDKKSISFRLYFRAPDRTLETEEVNDIQEDILDTLRQQFGARLRDE